MPITGDRYADWKAPREDGRVLVWPGLEELVRQTEENQKRLGGADHVRVQGVPLSALRRAMRRWIGHDDGRPLVATGHQTELYHPGVWAKNVLINRVAQATRGEAYLFAVDTDEPKHLDLKWPGRSVTITDDPGVTTVAWSGLLAPPTPAHLQGIEDELEVAAGGWAFKPMAGEFARSMRRLLPEADALSPTLVNALHHVDWELGLRHHAMIVSPMFMAEPYLLLVHHLMSRAGEFAGEYNAALAEYRKEQGIKTVGRPMPDLKVSAGERVESPFWIDDLGNGGRTRATLEKVAGGWSLRAHGAEFTFEERAGSDVAGRLLTWLRQSRVRISPRALTLTMFLRLFLADQFVHGIGGGRYDQVLDRLIEKHFGIGPPRFSVTTGTLYFPAAAGRERVCVRCVLQEGHRLAHAGLGGGKTDFLDRITLLPRRSLERRAVYHEMHRQMKVAGTATIEAWEQRLRETREREAEEQVLFDRELFYAIQPRDRLGQLIERYENLT